MTARKAFGTRRHNIDVIGGEGIRVFRMFRLSGVAASLISGCVVATVANAYPPSVVNDMKVIETVRRSPAPAHPFAMVAGASVSVSDERLGDMFVAAPSHSLTQTRFVYFGGAYLTVAAAPQPAHRTRAPDRLEGLNRLVFRANNISDKYIIVPLARGYRKVTTNKMRKALRNFLDNLDTPVTLVNDLLQGQFGRAAKTGGRFVINSAIGFGGVADPAAKLGIEDHSEDFGQTLAVWGVPSGPYLVLPFFGPSTLRDGFGLGIDSFFFSPLNYIRTGAAQKARLSRSGATLLALREPLIEPLEDIEKNSLDYYSSFRSFFLQARRREILNGKTAIEDLPNIDEYDEFDTFDDFDAPEEPVSPADGDETSPN